MPFPFLIRRAGRRDLEVEAPEVDMHTSNAPEDQPTGRRRWDPELERCRADNKYTRTNADGTTTVLSRGRFVSCNKQIKSTKQYRKAGGFQGDTFDMVVSPTWVPEKERAARMQAVPINKLLPQPKAKRGRAPAAVDLPEQDDQQPSLPFDQPRIEVPVRDRRQPMAAGASLPVAGGTFERERARQRRAAAKATRPLRSGKKQRGRQKDPQPAPLAPPGSGHRPGIRGGNRNLVEGRPVQVDVRTLLLSEPVYAPATFVRHGQANAVVVHADDPRVARSPATKALGEGLYAVDPTFIKQ